MACQFAAYFGVDQTHVREGFGLFHQYRTALRCPLRERDRVLMSKETTSMLKDLRKVAKMSMKTCTNPY